MASPTPEDIWVNFETSTAAFAAMYEEVTARLQRYKARLPEENEREWLDYLINGFSVEYRSWKTSLIARDYLELLDEYANGNQALLLTGHVYLHISYDLPRVMAASFSRLTLTRSRSREIFRKMAPIFIDSFERFIRRESFLRGVVALAATALKKLLPRRKTRALITIAGQFIHTLRSAAWLNAVNLATCTAPRMYAAELWDKVEQQVRLWMALSPDPVDWIANLAAPEIDLEDFEARRLNRGP
jgi:hypothetical protein